MGSPTGYYGQPGEEFDFAWHAPSGLVGQAGVRIVSVPESGVDPLPRTTVGVQEVPAGSGDYHVTLTRPVTPGPYAIVGDDGADPGFRRYAVDELWVSLDGEPRALLAGDALTSIFNAAGQRGLVGTAGIRILDTPGATEIVPRRTTGITELQDSGEDTGVYFFSELNVVPGEGDYAAVWDTGGAIPLFGTDLFEVTGVETVSTTELITIDNVAISDPATGSDVGVTDYPGLFGAPAPRDATQPIPEADGVIDLTRFYGPREFALEGWIRGSSWAHLEELQDRLGALFTVTEPHWLRIRRPGGREVMCIVKPMAKVSFERGDAVGPFMVWRVELRAADPLLYGTIRRTVTLDPFASSTSGLSWPLEWPWDWGDESTGTAEFINFGKATTNPIITFNGPWQNPWVENATTGTRLYTRALTLGDDDSLVIDTKERTVTLNGVLVTDRVDWGAPSDYPLLRSGSNILRAGGLPSPGSLLTVTAFDAWLT